jgi:hypothetical protein
MSALSGPQKDSMDVNNSLHRGGECVHWNTIPSLSPDPGFEYYFKACRKGGREPKAVTVNQSAVRALADASEITGLPRDNFEVHEISREEFEEYRSGATTG